MQRACEQAIKLAWCNTYRNGVDAVRDGKANLILVD